MLGARFRSKHMHSNPGGAAALQFIDLSREIYHRTPAHPSHPPVIMAGWYDHSEIKTAGKTRFTSKALHVSMSDHAGTHVDAPLPLQSGSGGAFDR